jgi:hypothetical protein
LINFDFICFYKERSHILWFPQGWIDRFCKMTIYAHCHNQSTTTNQNQIDVFPRPACKARGCGHGAIIYEKMPPLKIGEVAETKIRPGFC